MGIRDNSSHFGKANRNVCQTSLERFEDETHTQASFENIGESVHRLWTITTFVS